jgi:Dolichyl-phosphate-mannose-protein mannosyltransferase
MGELSTGVLERARAVLPAARSEAVRDQAAVATGQVGAGLGNMVFSLVMAHLLAPGAFAQLASFLALYLVLSLPGSSISAAAALAPARAASLAPAMRRGGFALGLGLVAGAPWIGPALRLPVAMVVVLGVSGPALGVLALERGRLYAGRGHGRLVSSLVAEPAVRLLIGTVLATSVGAVGGALGVTAATYAALEVARRRRRRPQHAATRSGRPRAAALPSPGPPAGSGPVVSDAQGGAVAWTAVAFLLLVVLQNQDLLIANRVLSPAAAGQFAVISTLGGVAAFATLTAPLVLLPRAAAGTDDGFASALGLSVLIGGAALAATALAPASLIAALFGARYEAVAPLATPYVGAMALLGIARVLVAQRCSRAPRTFTTAALVSAVAAQAILILEFGHSPRAVAYSTLAATGGLTVALGGASVLRLPALERWLATTRGAIGRVARSPVTAAFVLGTALRFVIPRGLWLDEATTVWEARMPFHAMINTLRTTDVHPPLYFAIVWETIRVFGSGPLAVRLPSIVAGALVVPMLYLLGKEAYDRRTGIVASLAGVVAPFMVWYSQEARMYSLMMLLGVVAMWAQIRILRRGGNAFVWSLYALASVALVWTQYFGLLQVIVQQAAFAAVVYGRRRRHDPRASLLAGWLITGAAIAVALAPLVPFAHQQFIVNQTAGRGFGGPQQVGTGASSATAHLGVYSAVANLIWAIWGYHSDPTMALLAALWPLGMLAALLLLGRRRQGATSLLVAAVIGPGLAMFALGLVKRNLFDVRYLSTTVPLLFVLVARMVTGIATRRALVALATTALVGTLVWGLLDQQYNGANPRIYDFSQALQRVDSEERPGDVLLYDPSDLIRVVQYYSPHVHAQPLRSSLGSAGTTGRVYVLASRSLMNGPQDTDDLSHALIVLGERHRLISRRLLANVEVWTFR